MRKLLIPLAAAAVAAAIAVPLGLGSSHREAPNIMLDAAADNTDVYAFTAKDSPGSLTVVSNWIPGQNPANGPNFFRFDDRAHYYINIDNTGDGNTDVRYLFKFKTRVNKNSFLYAGPGTTKYSQLGTRQTYDVFRERLSARGNVKSSSKIGGGLPVAPSNIGPKTFPNYGALANGAIKGLKGSGKVFAGQREDPFFVDLGATFDALNVRMLTGNKGQGKDDFSGMNTNSVVLQVPESQVTKDGQSVDSPTASNAVVGVWSSTERRSLEVTNSDFDSNKGSKGEWVQVSRLGNPLVNEVVIPLGQKDKFNRTKPAGDAKNYGAFVVKPELAAILNALFKVNAPENNRTDIVQALLQGIPKLNQQVPGKAPPAVDTLKLNLGVPPASGTPNRFGVIGGDNAGFPNGRRLEDDVVDIELQVVAGILKGNKVPLGDGVDQNDKTFLSTFPYVGAPFAGFDSAPSTRIEPAHAPTGAGGGA